MGQLFIVQGSDSHEVSELFQRGVAAASFLNGNPPLDRLEQPGLGIAVFPRKVAATPIVRDPADAHDPHAAPAWICGAGAWFYDGKSGAEGLRRLAAGAFRQANSDAWLKPSDGAFAIVLAGKEPDEIAAITDRLGTLHLYKAHSGSCVLLSTSSLVLAATLRPQWDFFGLRYFLSTGSVFERHSLFSGVEKLPPASLFRFARGKLLEERKYWRLADVSYDKAQVQGDVPGLAAGLARAVAMIGANFPGAVLDLTGGYDSRALIGAMLQDPALRFHTVVNGPPDSPDVVVARQIAERFGLPHERRDRGPVAPDQFWKRAVQSVVMTDGECDMLLQAPVLETHSALSDRFEASINGSNGEICKGQWWEVLLPHMGTPGHFDARVIAAKRFAYGPSAAPLLNFEFSDQLVDDFAEIIRRATAGMEEYPNTSLLDCVYLTLRMQRWQGRIMSASARLWPVISPFAFREPMEMALSAPVQLKVRHRMSRRLIEYQNPQLASLPLAQGYPALPVRWNTLHRFWPLAVETGQMGLRYALRAAGLKQRRDSHSGYPLARVAGLEEVRELLSPAQMVSREIYRDDRLKDFVASDLKTAATPECFGRLLTVELAARAVRDAAASAAGDVKAPAG